MLSGAPFRFLSLSACTLIKSLYKITTLIIIPELRNRIYDFATENSDDECAVKIGDVKRVFFHLTQTCRQIRSEFCPIYMAKTGIYTKDVDVIPFLKVFIPSWKDEAKEKNSSIADILVYCDDTWRKSEVSLFTLLRLTVMAPNVRITFRESSDYLNRQFDDIFNHQAA
jgi:hypothetical protein